jgi:Na+(H+)/acetate symporter ActP
LALVFGVAGLPLVLMRLFSVANARAARNALRDWIHWLLLHIDLRHRLLWN